MSIDFTKLQGYIEEQGQESGDKGGDLISYARDTAEKLGIPPDMADRLIRLESGGRPDAVSPKGAFGPAQLMPATARELASKYGGDPSDPYDNIRLGLHYLKDNFNQFGDWGLAAAAYQAGPGAVRKAGGVPDKTDGITRTADYVKKVVPGGLGIGAFMPVPKATPAQGKGAEDDGPVLTGDYSEFQKPLPFLPRHQDGPWPTISNAEDLPQQQADAAAADRKARLSFGEKVGMGVKKGAAQSVGLLGGVGAAVGDALDIESLQKSGMELYRHQMEKAQQYSIAPSIMDVADGKADFSDWLAENIGYGAYQVTESLLTAGVGSFMLKGAMKPAAAGLMKGFIEKEVASTLAAPIEAEAKKLIASGVASTVAKDMAARTVATKMGEQALKAATSKAAMIGGGVLAGVANNFRQELGSIYGDAAEAGTVDWAKILPASVGATALDSLAEAYFGAKVLGTGHARAGSYATRLAKELPAQMLVQGGTEGGQSAIEQWGSGAKTIDGRQVIDEAAVGALMGGAGAPVSAMPKAEEKRPPPSGMLGRAAEAGRAADPTIGMTAAPGDPAGAPGSGPVLPAGPAGSGGASAPLDGRLQAIVARVQDRSLLDAMRADPNFGAESATELLRAVAVARNPNVDPMQRTQAADAAERMLHAFEQQPNFTMPGNSGGAGNSVPGRDLIVPGQTPLAPFAAPNTGATIDGEFSRYGGELPDPAVPPSRRLPPAAVRALPDPEKQRVLRDAEAEYEQAFADLIKVEQLGADEAQLRAAAQAHQYAEARLSEIQEAIAGGQAAYSAQIRRSVLDEVLADPATANPVERFQSELRRQGFNEATARPEELARIQRFTDIRDAKPVEPEVIPSTPNEMDAGAMGVRERGARPTTEQGAADVATRIPGTSGEAQRNHTGSGVSVPAVADFAGGTAGSNDASGGPAAPGGSGGQAQPVRYEGLSDTALTGDGSPDAAASAAPDNPGPTEADHDKRTEIAIASDLTNTAPTDGQKEAGNYLKGRVQVQGFNVAIESPKGSTRTGKDKDGTEWSVVMPADYGYIERTEGADGDQVDVFVGEHPESGQIWVINQNKVDSTKFDEHKVMLGFASEDAAMDAYFGSFAGNFAQKVFHSIDGPYTADELRALLPKLKKAKAVKEKIPAGESVPDGSPAGRADLRPEIESLIRMKSAARQIGKEDALQAIIDRAKAYMAGGPSEPGVFIVRAKQFKALPAVETTAAQIVDKIKAARAPQAEAGDGTVQAQQGDAGADVAPVENQEQAQPDADRQGALDEPAPSGEGGGDAPVLDVPPAAGVAPGAALENATAPEHVQGVDDRELGQIVDEFNSAQKSMVEDGYRVTHVFDAPAKREVVRLEDKVKVFNKSHGWMTVEEARAKVAEWKAHAQAQGDDPRVRTENSKKVVLSLFDLSGEWSKPWEEAGYQVFRFDIQADPDMGDVNNFSTDFFNDWFSDFDDMDIHAILAACPCTDFAVSGARHFEAKDADGRTVSSVKLVHQTLRVIEYFKPAVWAVENPVGRIEKLGGLPPWRLSFNPNHLGDPYTKKTLIWGRFNGDLPVAPVEPTEGSKMHRLYGGKSQATKNARSVTPEGFSYGFFMANNAHDHPAMTLANKYDRLDRALIEKAVDAGIPADEIETAVEDFYYMELDDDAANEAIRDLIKSRNSSATLTSSSAKPERTPVEQFVADNAFDDWRNVEPRARALAKGLIDAGFVSEEQKARMKDAWSDLPALVAEIDGVVAANQAPAKKGAAAQKGDVESGGDVDVRLLAARNDLIEMRTAAEAQGRVADDRLLERIRNQQRYIAELEAEQQSAQAGRTNNSPLRSELEQMSGEELRAVMDRMNLAGARMTHDERVETLLAEDEAEVRAAMVAPEPAAEPEVRNPKTLDEFYGDVDAGYRAHFDYAGTAGTTIWVEKTDRGWVVKQKDDDSTAVFTKGGAGAGGGWGKLGAMTAAKNLASYRFNQWKPIVETAAKEGQRTQVVDNGSTNPGEYLVRGDGHNLARFKLNDRGRPVGVKFFFDSVQTRNLAQDAIDAFAAERGVSGATTASQPESVKQQLAVSGNSEPSGNTVFTDDAYAKAREVLRRKLGQVNTGLDPEIIQAGLTVAGYHIEKGARTFVAFAKAVVSDMGDSVRPYLKSWYMGVKYDPRAAKFSGDMSSAGEVEASDVDSLFDDKSTASDDKSTVDEKQQQADAVADAIGKAVAASPVIVEHVTAKGKTLRGIVRTDLTQDEAKAIDKFTFKKNGGYFIREQYLNDLPPENKPAAQPEPGPVADSLSKPEENNADATQALLDMGFTKVNENTWAMSRTFAPGERVLLNVREYGRPREYRLSRSMTFPGTGITGSPTQEVGKYASWSEVVAAAKAELENYPAADAATDPEATTTEPAPAPKTRIEPSDIPPAFLRKHMVKTRIYVEAERADVEVEIPADKALQLLGEELDRLKAVRECVRT